MRNNKKYKSLKVGKKLVVKKLFRDFVIVIILFILIVMVVFFYNYFKTRSRIKKIFREYQSSFEAISKFVYKEYSANEHYDNATWVYCIKKDKESNSFYILIKENDSESKEREITLDEDMQNHIINVRKGYYAIEATSGPSVIMVNEKEIVFYNSEQTDQIIFSLDGNKGSGMANSTNAYYKEVVFFELGEGWYAYRPKSTR